MRRPTAQGTLVELLPFYARGQPRNRVFDTREIKNEGISLWLGAFASPQHAADNLARGLTCPHLSEADTATLEIPEIIDDWEIVHV